MRSSDENHPKGKLRIAVFGQSQVGKSALTVRYLTKRFIGEYKSNTDMFYHQSLKIHHGTTLDVEIVDISTSENSPLTTSPAKWDGIILVYSITDRGSYKFAAEALSKITNKAGGSTTSAGGSPTPPLPPIILTANKNDLEHLRVVEKYEGLNLALEHGCHFYELSVSQNSPQVYQVFHIIINNIKPQKRKFSVSKILFNISKIGYARSETETSSSSSSSITNSFEIKETCRTMISKSNNKGSNEVAVQNKKNIYS